MSDVTEIFLIAKPGQPPVGFALTEQEANEHLARLRSKDPNSWWRVIKDFFEMWERDNPLAPEFEEVTKPRRRKGESERDFKGRMQQWDLHSRKSFEARNKWERAKLDAGNFFVQKCFGYPDYATFKIEHPRKKGAPEYEILRVQRLTDEIVSAQQPA